MRQHALLSASGAHRWLHCTPSARLEESMPESLSAYADEGTLAHSFAELELLRLSNRIIGAIYVTEKAKLLNDKHYKDDMPGYVQAYVNYVAEQLNGDIDNELYIEQKLDLTDYVPDGFGTADAIVVSQNTVEVIDLKYGMGVKVDVTDNPQLKLYALGALKLYKAESVIITVVQPRLDSISSQLIPVAELLSWGESYVKPRATIAYEGKGQYQAGDHCRWCKAKVRCTSLAAKNLELAKENYKNPDLLSDDKLLYAYQQVSRIQDWLNSVSDYLLSEALKGKQWPGYKLVEGRSTRKWSDEEQIKAFLDLSFDPSDYLETKLAGIPAIEKLVGKQQFLAMSDKYIVKAPGRPTLVEESDKRPAINRLEQVKMDFKIDNYE